MSKKAQGLSMNVIIIAAIALLVLVILAVIFIGRMGQTTKGIDICKGQCVADRTECKALGPYYDTAQGDCVDANGDPTGEVCCVGV